MKAKININRPEITSEEIASRRDFQSVLKSYNAAAKPIWQKPWFLSSVAAVVVAGTVIVTLMQINQPQEPFAEKANTLMPDLPTDTTDERLPFIKPPLEDVDVNYTTFSVNANKGKTLEYESGTKIHIPDNCFADENGNLLSGEVEIKYREFHDPVDFFVSGIPMDYDSANTEYTFESAGMLEILAYQNGKPVFIHPEKEIKVEMVSDYDGTQYNLYRLDTTAENWVCEGKDEVIKEQVQVMADATDAVQLDVWGEEVSENVSPKEKEVKKLETEIKTIQKEIVEIKKQEPKKPKKLRKDRYTFNIDVDAGEFPEITVYKGLQWEVGRENKNFNAKWYEITWEDISLTEKEKGVSYNLILTKSNDKRTVTVYPVYEGKDYETAVQQFTKKFAAYSTKLNNRKAEEKRKQEEYEARLKQLEEERATRQKAWEDERKKWEERQRKFAERQRKQAQNINYGSIRRVFSISGFGIFNSDYPTRYKSSETLLVDFTDENGKKLEVDIAYHIDRNKNSLYAHYVYSKSFGGKYRFTYNPNAQNVLFVAFPENKIGVFTEDDFVKIKKKSGTYTFKLKIADQEFTKIDEIKEFLDI